MIDSANAMQDNISLSFRVVWRKNCGKKDKVKRHFKILTTEQFIDKLETSPETGCLLSDWKRSNFQPSCARDGSFIRLSVLKHDLDYFGGFKKCFLPSYERLMLHQLTKTGSFPSQTARENCKTHENDMKNEALFYSFETFI